LRLTRANSSSTIITYTANLQTSMPHAFDTNHTENDAMFSSATHDRSYEATASRRLQRITRSKIRIVADADHLYIVVWSSSCYLHSGASIANKRHAYKPFDGAQNTITTPPPVTSAPRADVVVVVVTGPSHPGGSQSRAGAVTRPSGADLSSADKQLHLG